MAFIKDYKPNFVIGQTLNYRAFSLNIVFDNLFLMEVGRAWNRSLRPYFVWWGLEGKPLGRIGVSFTLPPTLPARFPGFP